MLNLPVLEYSPHLNRQWVTHTCWYLLRVQSLLSLVGSSLCSSEEAKLRTGVQGGDQGKLL